MLSRFFEAVQFDQEMFIQNSLKEAILDGFQESGRVELVSANAMATGNAARRRGLSLFCFQFGQSSSDIITNIKGQDACNQEPGLRIPVGLYSRDNAMFLTIDLNYPKGKSLVTTLLCPIAPASESHIKVGKAS